MSMEYVCIRMYVLERPWRERSFASVTASSILVVVDCSQVDENRRSPCCVTNTSPRIQGRLPARFKWRGERSYKMCVREIQLLLLPSHQIFRNTRITRERRLTTTPCIIFSAPYCCCSRSIIARSKSYTRSVYTELYYTLNNRIRVWNIERLSLRRY